MDQSKAVFQLWVNSCLLLKYYPRQDGGLNLLSAVFMSETFGIRELKPYQTEAKVQFLQKIDVLPFVFDSIFEGCWPCFCCGFAACKSYQRPVRSTSWQILEFLPLLLVISVKKMQEVYEQGNG